MPKLIILIFLLFPLFFNSCNLECVKYDYVSFSKVYNRKVHYSIVQNYYTDSITKKYFVRLDSINTIKEKSANFELTERFNDTIHYLDGIFLLKTNVDYLKTTWRSPYEKDKCDSLNITLLNVIDTVIQGQKFERCFVYYVKYDKYTMDDALDFIIYFDLDKRAVLKKVYYQGIREKGTEELIKISKL